MLSAGKDVISGIWNILQLLMELLNSTLDLLQEELASWLTMIISTTMLCCRLSNIRRPKARLLSMTIKVNPLSLGSMMQLPVELLHQLLYYQQYHLNQFLHHQLHLNQLSNPDPNSDRSLKNLSVLKVITDLCFPKSTLMLSVTPSFTRDVILIVFLVLSKTTTSYSANPSPLIILVTVTLIKFSWTSSQAFHNLGEKIMM